jgi:Aldo/keto reductase family
MMMMMMTRCRFLLAAVVLVVSCFPNNNQNGAPNIIICCTAFSLFHFPSLPSYYYNRKPTGRRNQPHANNFSSSSSSLMVLHNNHNNNNYNNNKMDSVDRRTLGKKAFQFLGAAALTTTTTASNNNNRAAAAAASGEKLSQLPPYTTIPEWTLSLQGEAEAVSMPTLALNTVGLSTEETERAVGYAVSLGMTHIDFHPGKERDGVAAFLQQQQQPHSNTSSSTTSTTTTISTRSKLFLNTKIRKAPPGTLPQDAADQTRQQIRQDLQALHLDQVDMLMLRDSPDPNVIQAQWQVLEEALDKGQTRSIGVINFCQSALEAVLQTAKIPPALNYYM